MGQRGDPEYITGNQLTVIETLLLGLRKKCATDFYTTFSDGYLKVESTKILLDAGYTLLDRVDPENCIATQLTPNEVTGTVDAVSVPILSSSRKQASSDVITLKPAVHIALQSVAEFGQVRNNELERGLERLCSAEVNVLIVACGLQAYNHFQEHYPSLVPPVETLQSYFSESPQRYTSKNGELQQEEFNFRACRAPNSNGNTPRIVFAVVRPNALQKQVEKLLEVAVTLEQDNTEITDDTEALTLEIDSLKKEIERLNSEHDTIQGGSGEFEAERDLLKEERDEVAGERDALKMEAAALRKELRDMEIELEAMKELESKRTYLSDDDEDVKTTSHKVADESLELGLDDDEDEDDGDLKVVATLEDAADELEERPEEKIIPTKIETSSKKKSIPIVDEDEDDDIDAIAETSDPIVADDDLADADEAEEAGDADDDDDDADDDDGFVIGKVIYTNQPPLPTTEEKGEKATSEKEEDGGDSSDWSDADE